MGKRLVTKNGNDCVYTPNDLAKAIVEYYRPSGLCLEPCKGKESFIDAFKYYGIKYDWAELSNNRDFLTYNFSKTI